MMTDDFHFILSENGFPEDPEFLQRDELSKVSKILPKSLVDFWEEVGVGSWHQKLFNFCKPSDFQDLLFSILEDDSEISPKDCAMYGYTAFGELSIWHRTMGTIHVNLPLGWVYGDFMSTERQLQTNVELGPDRVIAIGLPTGGQATTFRDEKNRPLFEQAVKKYGKLTKGQCFGFVPALALGGKIRLENVRRLSAPEHFSILAGLGHFTLIKFDDNARRVNIRKIGE